MATLEQVQENQVGQSNEDNRTQMIQATVKAWRKETIYKTKGVTATQEKILSQDCVCVIGFPGAGKSTAIHHAALSLENQGFTLYSIDKLEEFLKYFDEDKKQVFILDDVLGIYSVTQSKVDLWNEHNYHIKDRLGTHTKLLVSIRTQIYNQAVQGNNFVFLDKSACIDFCDQSYRLDMVDMKGMLTYYMTVQGVDNIDELIRQIYFPNCREKKFHDMTKDERENLFFEDSVGLEFYYCFPLLCKVFCNDKFARHNPREFFYKPFRALTKIFQAIKLNNKLQFCGLVLCTVLNGTLTEDMFHINRELDHELDTKSLELHNVIMKACNLEGPEYLPQIRSALKSLDGVYVKLVDKTYKIAHSVFFDVVTYLFNDTQPLFLLKYGTSEFICDRIRLSKTQSGKDPYMIIINDDKNIERLADRLFRDLKSDEQTGNRFIIRNPNIDNDRLISSLKTKLSDRKQTDDKIINELFHWCIFVMYNQIDTYKHGDVNLFKLIEICVQRGVGCNMKIIGLAQQSPLHVAVQSSSLQLTKLLLDNGADKRRVNHNWFSVLHNVCRFTKYNKLELIKLLTQHGEDHSVVSFITSVRQGILLELEDENGTHEILHELEDGSYKYKTLPKLDHENLQLEEVLSDNSIKILTTDKHEMKQYVQHHTGRLQLVRRLHDNILTFVNGFECNILHWSIDSSENTRYLLGLTPLINQAINQRDIEGRTPFWYIVNKQYPHSHEEVKILDKDRQNVIQLYKDNHAKLLYDSNDSGETEMVEVIYDINMT